MGVGGERRVRGAAPVGVDRTVEAGDGQVGGCVLRVGPHGERARHDLLDGDASAGALAQLDETLAQPLVARRGPCSEGRHRAVVLALEDQPPEGRLLRVEGGHPPHDRLVLRPGERHVEQPEVLAALLDPVPLLVLLERRAGAGHVDPPLAARLQVVEDDGRLLVGDPARLPHVGVVDDRELEALAGVDRQHLHRLGVGLEAAAALLGAPVGGRLGDPLAHPGGEGGDAQPRRGRLLVEQLADVAEVGEQALAEVATEHPLGERGRAGDQLQQRRHARAAEHAGPHVHGGVQLLELGVGGGIEVGSGAPDERGDRRGARPGVGARSFERFEQPQPVERGGRGEHRPGAVDHRRHARVGEGVRPDRRVAGGAGEHGEVARAHGFVAVPAAIVGPVDEGGAGREQVDDVGGEVAGDVVPHPGLRHGATRGDADIGVVAPEHPEAHGLRHDGADQPALAVMRCGRHLAIADRWVAEGGVAEERVVGEDQVFVAAPVGRQRVHLLRGARGVEVRVHVGAAEGVDRLLGVADHHERAVVVAEGIGEDLPLQLVGVLELVDEHHPVAVAQASSVDRSDVLVVQRVGEPGEEVVVGDHAGAALATLDLLAHGERQPHPQPRWRRAVVDRRRGQRRARVVEDGLGDRARRRQVERRDRAGEGALEVAVVDHLVDEVGDPLDDLGVGLDVAGDAEPGEHLVAEAVGGRDRGGVEVAQRGGEAITAALDLGRVGVGEEGEHLVGRVGRVDRLAGERRGQPALGGQEALPDALAQLARGHPGERDEQQVVDRQTVGDVAGGERGDGERLAGAGTRLEHGRAGGQRAAHVEGLRFGHDCSTRSWASSGSHSRRA